MVTHGLVDAGDDFVRLKRCCSVVEQGAIVASTVDARSIVQSVAKTSDCPGRNLRSAERHAGN